MTRIIYDLNWYDELQVQTAKGPRRVWAPKAPLRKLQGDLLMSLSITCVVHEAATAYAPGCSAWVNALRHAGAKYLLQTDIRHFFDHVTTEKVQRRLRQLGFREPLAQQVLDVCVGPGFLPQGSLTAPLLANTVCFHLDEQLSALAPLAVYTRYADDITFSAAEREALPPAASVENILRGWGFEPHGTRSLGAGEPLEVTGLLVGPPSPGKPVVRAPKRLRRRLRAMEQELRERPSRLLEERVRGLRAHIEHANQLEVAK